ncbi:MAG: DUF3391 domain-containing protein [Betaproteobacteria bacterium]|nr:MAG: DUF3391 domain-containing protein [Betaproteobacteria bacterium]
MGIAGTTAAIDVDALRVGMFVHLDVGWMAHPFPLSSFKIAAVEQIATIRSLGLKQVRWSPEHSEPEAPPVSLVLSATHAAPVDPEAAARRERREALAAQRAALTLCERQFAEATRECRQITDLVRVAPTAASEKAHALSRTLVDKMLAERELCIRLLTEGAGDMASAHAMNVTVISLLMGRSFGFCETDMLDLGVGAMLHDIGKVDLPERARHRGDDFSAAEAKRYEEHVTHGVDHALKMALSPLATLVISQHHEHADGSGFPLALGSERMTPASSIVALVDRYDTLCNPPLAAQALTPHEAVSLLFAQGKNRYDPAVLSGFIKMLGVYPPGSVVQLTDDRFAIVVGANSSRPLKPRVLAHDPKVPADEALIIDLEAATNLGIRRSIKPAALSRDALAALSPRRRVAYFFEPVHDAAWAA